MGLAYRIAEWIMLLAYVNLLWIFFTGCGLVIAGAFPATAGLFAVVRKWILQGTDLPVWKTFWRSYRKEFLKANLVGYLYLAAGWLIYIDLKFFQNDGGTIGLVLSYMFLLAFIFYIVMGLFLFPVFVHFDLKLLKYFKQTFFIVMLRPFEAIVAAAGMLGVYFVMIFVPGFIPFFSVSLAAFIAMKMAHRAIDKISLKVNPPDQEESS
jgi:uncharacterized membrane protein YesL